MNNKLKGSSTCCIVNIEKNNFKVNTANLGDSGYMVIRPQENKITERSKEQQHHFNAPYQLAMLPNKEKYKKNLSDRPDQSTVSHFKVNYDDIIVIGTDGLFGKNKI
jgi:protein phosphatase PTC7